MERSEGNNMLEGEKVSCTKKVTPSRKANEPGKQMTEC